MPKNVPNQIDSTLMPFYLPGTPHFVQTLQLFLAHTDEYEALYPWYLQFLESLQSKRFFLEIGIGDGGSLSKDTDQHFQLGIAIEKSVSLLPIINQNCPNTQVIGKQIEQVSEQEIRTLLADNTPDFKAKYTPPCGWFYYHEQSQSSLTSIDFTS